jgi:biopolymer transport protein ExbD
MAAIEETNAKRKKTGLRMHKKNTKVDLTPMVDLGFLLITFFVFTTTMAQPKAMSVISPKESTEPSPVCESCALTVIPAAGDKLYYYEGVLDESTALSSTAFDAAGLRALLLDKKEKVKNARGNSDELSLIIRPADESTYKNFVDVLDEVNITGVKRYYIDDITEAEKQLLKNAH